MSTEKVGTPAAAPAAEAVVIEKEKVPEAIFPRCPYCREHPLKIKRLRYDFPDGVVAEVIFCSNSQCLSALSTLIVGIERPKR